MSPSGVEAASLGEELSVEAEEVQDLGAAVRDIVYGKKFSAIQYCGSVQMPRRMYLALKNLGVISHGDKRVWIDKEYLDNHAKALRQFFVTSGNLTSNEYHFKGDLLVDYGVYEKLVRFSYDYGCHDQQYLVDQDRDLDDCIKVHREDWLFPNSQKSKAIFKEKGVDIDRFMKRPVHLRIKRVDELVKDEVLREIEDFVYISKQAWAKVHRLAYPDNGAALVPLENAASAPKSRYYKYLRRLIVGASLFILPMLFAQQCKESRMAMTKILDAISGKTAKVDGQLGKRSQADQASTLKHIKNITPQRFGDVLKDGEHHVYTLKGDVMTNSVELIEEDIGNNKIRLYFNGNAIATYDRAKCPRSAGNISKVIKYSTGNYTAEFNTMHVDFEAAFDNNGNVIYGISRGKNKENKVKYRSGVTLPVYAIGC